MKSSICLLALVTGLAGCGGQSSVDDTTMRQADISAGSSAPMPQINDALIAPAQPSLSITATTETLLLSWDTDHPAQRANIYEYDLSTGKETLLVSDIAPPITTLSVPSESPLRAWHARQFRVELCDSQDCISSDRVAINTLLAATSHTLRPAVFLQGERFAETVTANHDASLVASTLPVEGAIQIHFHNQQQWIATQPIRLDLADSHRLLDIHSSKTDDTLAALVQHDEGVAQAGSVHILERLGEVWLPTIELPIPAGTLLDTYSRLQLSATADHVYLHTPQELLVYHRGMVEWTLHSTLPAPSDGILVATHSDADPTRIHALQREQEEVYLTLYQLSGDREPPTWRQIHQHPVQGVNVAEALYLQSNAEGSSIVIAGWGNSHLLQERSPVLWRFESTGDIGSGADPEWTVVDSVRMSPASDSDAELRFSVSVDLATVALGWHSPSGDSAQLSTFTFDFQERAYRVALELPHDLPTLAKQNFARDVVLSADGGTLLVSTLAGRSTPSTNTAGELLVLR